MDTDAASRVAFFNWMQAAAWIAEEDREDELRHYLREWFLAGVDLKTTAEMELCLNYLQDPVPHQYDAMIEHYRRKRSGH